MRSIVLRLAYLAAAISGLAWSAAGAIAGAEDEINQVEDRRYDAMIRNDAALLADTLAEEFQYHQPNGKVNDKPGYIAQMKSGTVKIFKAERYNVKIHVYGDIATAMGETRLDLELGGQRRNSDLRYLNVWVKRDGRWQLAARQSAFKQ
ncbi:MAG TPA: nuclear transport factor 2 family protein [Burkholderiales bacterium]|nr:nuclear transport factor 2 family protein [Burkholderiales bacterium]